MNKLFLGLVLTALVGLTSFASVPALALADMNVPHCNGQDHDHGDGDGEDGDIEE